MGGATGQTGPARQGWMRVTIDEDRLGDVDLPSRPLDELDHLIISRLRSTPRMTNKEIAQVTGYSESTIANRIRSLTDRRSIKILLQRDFHLLGWSVLTMNYIQVEHRGINAVAADLAKLPEALSVTILTGIPQIACTLAARSQEHLATLLRREVAGIEGVGFVETSVWTTVVKYRADLSNLQQ